MKLRYTLLVASIGAILTGCSTLTPEIPQATSNIPSKWTSEENKISDNKVIEVSQWKKLVKDETLFSLIEKSIENNRDIQVALLNVEKIKTQYQIQDSNRNASVTGTLSANRERIGDNPISESWQAVGAVSYEIDLFSKAENLSKTAWQNYLAESYNYEVAKIALISEVSSTYLDLLANKEWLKISKETLDSRLSSYSLSEKRKELGQVSSLTLAQERGLVENARSDVALYDGTVKQLEQNLRLLVGESIDSYTFNSEWKDVLEDNTKLVSNLSSDVLLSRPDIKASEARLIASNANIGVARASRFPSLSLTGQAGTISSEFSGLMGSNTGLWGISPSLNVPIFNAGRLKAQEQVARIEQEKALANYEKNIQVGFQEVAVLLIENEKLNKQHEAQEEAVEAAEDAYNFSKIRYDAGRDDYLSLLDSERTLYATQIRKISLELAQQKVFISLYKALGGISN